ncbi:hypothetical protein BBJ29_004139 [Phytophthora kernoviae]|uniref:Hydrogen voltage-gated channel 1 n=1 Tax=Phytophthora kernoviae TaxID=325452 RepID=A0A3F2RQZ6_9STRA|nr:hypothetical protein BBJ29_004139 [Phytophthora kernoviae]RLN61703.1 hypothetical protein BBP00_00005219 [Phytophthora kernoviae]
MEKRTSVRRKAVPTGEPKSTARGVTSDAESTVSTRSSNSSTDSSVGSSLKWKREQRRIKANRLSSDDSCGKGKGLRQDQDEGIGEDGENVQLKSLQDTLGAILETTEAQMVTILLIALDVCCTAVEMHLHNQQHLAVVLQQLNSVGKTGAASSSVAESLLMRIATRLVESFMGFTLFLFLIELAVLLAAFRQKFFAHAGYVLDLMVVSVSLTVELYAQTKAVRLLGVLRIWRVLRMVRRLIDRERRAHDATHLLLEQEQVRLIHVRMQKNASQESLKREYESREGLEQLLRSYKDEIMTLKEALQIAAQAVAKATVDKGETIPVDSGLYTFTGDAVIESTYASFTPAPDSEFVQEYHHDVAAVHPTDLLTELETQDWQGSDRGESDFEDAVGE